jgi:hypothetical protein
MQNFSPGQFEFLITGDIELTSEQSETLMLPFSFQVQQVERNGWIYFHSTGDEFSYSWEPQGIQMTFNKECTFQKAKQIADEILQNLREAGFDADILLIENSQIIKFD